MEFKMDEELEQPVEKKAGRPPNLKPVMDAERVQWLRFHPNFTLLSPAQQEFVIAYIANGGNMMDAVHSVYHPANDRNARDMGMRYLRMFSIRRAIATYMGIEAQVVADTPMTKAEFICLLASRLRKKGLSDPLFVAYSKLLLETREWQPEPRRRPGRPRKYEEAPPIAAEPVEEEFNIDDMVRRIEEEKKKLMETE